MIRRALLAVAVVAGCRTAPAPAPPPPPPAPVPMAEAPADHDVIRELRALRKEIAERRTMATDLIREAHEALDRAEYRTAEEKHRTAKRAEAEAADLSAREPGLIKETARRLLPDLDDDDIAVREEATRALIELGTDALPTLKEEGRGLPSEAARRVAHVVRTLEERLSFRQWASEARASSEYSSPDWSAAQVAGAPNTPVAGDQRTAWASKTEDADTEWLEVVFAKPVVPLLIRIRETFNAGAVVKVEARDPLGGWRTLWSGAASAREAPFWFEVRAADAGWATREVRITLDSDAVPGWNEIDAVELVGRIPEGKSPR